MAVLSGFEYDIFISYRHNDNRSGWVTEFVNALQEELAATIKEPLTIYFDKNPHDGLLETHNVDKSLEGKLKCLIFIPIISQTYCDAKSFAWQHEFVAFNKLAIEGTPLSIGDGQGVRSFGRDIKLSNGNVASRILPIKIHDLDTEDKAIIENEIGGVLRAIEFIYREAGVNRPLRSHEENPEKNQNQTIYRNQVNKVANAVKEIITSLKKPFTTTKTTDYGLPNIPTQSSSNWKTVAFIAGFLILLTSVYFFNSRQTGLKDPANSGIAILPFKNNTGSSELDYYGIGMASAIQTKLSLSKRFNFISSLQASLHYNKTDKTPQQIGSELVVDYMLSGLYQKAGNKIKVEVELIDTKNGHVIWTLPFENELADIFQIQAKIAEKVIAQFSNGVDTIIETKATSNLQAYAHYMRGKQLLESAYGDSTDWATSYNPIITQFESAIEMDSTFIDAWTDLISVECFVFQGEQTNKVREQKIKKYYEYFNSHFPDSWQKKLVQGQFTYRVLHDNDAALSLMLEALEENPDNVHATYAASVLYKRKLDFKKAIEFAVKLLNLSPGHGGNWINLGSILEISGDPKDAFKAKLKGWNLSHSKHFGLLAMVQAMKADFPVDQLPTDLKKELGLEFEFMNSAQKRDWHSAKKISLQNKDQANLAFSYLELGKKDSARYWIKQALRNKTIDSSQYFAVMGEKAKALSSFKLKVANQIDTDLLSLWTRQCDEIDLLIILGEYKEATQKLVKLNTTFPTVGDYAQYVYMPFYDRVKQEYPPFAETLSSIKRNPIVDINELIEL